MKKKIAFISGSTKGIGLSIASRLHDDGLFIVLNSRKKKNFDLIKKKFKDYDFFLGDVSQAKNVKKIYYNFKKKFKNIDVLICNVGLSSFKNKNSSKKNNWYAMFESNFLSAVNLVSAFKKDLIRSKGRIIFISSIASKQFLDGPPIEYACMKSALNTYCKILSKELGPRGVNCNNIILGNVNFKGSIWSKKNKNVIKKNLNLMTTKKFITTDEVSNLVSFLLDKKNRSFSGSDILLDGGQINNL